MLLLTTRRPSTRRLATAAAAALVLGAVTASGPVQGATGVIDYDCEIDGSYSFTFPFDQDTNNPTSLFVGKTFAPTYQATTALPGEGVGLARFFGVKSFDGEIEATVLINGSPVQVVAPIPRTQVPTSGDLVLTATGPLPQLAPTSAGPRVYKPGKILLTINAYTSEQGPETLFVLDKGDCVMTPNTATIDTVRVLKSNTSTTTAVAYAKATRKVTAAARITSTSGVPANGKVLFTLFKGTTKVRTVTAVVSAGKARAVFTKIKAKGAYKVVGRYAGSSALNGSTGVKTFRIR